jgi:hypothetical protein
MQRALQKGSGMKKNVLGLATGLLIVASTSTAFAVQYIEYYRDNLFLGLAYHRVGCLTNWYTIQSGQEYDGFTTKQYCTSGATATSVPGGKWFAWDFARNSSVADSCGQSTNNRYGTPNYAARSNTCNYNILFDCNSDCWIREFGKCMDRDISNGQKVPKASPCW